MPKIRYFIEQSWLLIGASFCFGLLIAVTNAGLSPKIRENRAAKLNRLTVALLPEAKRFVELDEAVQVKLPGGKKEQIKVFKAVSDTGQCIGWSFNAGGQGFADRIELVVAVDGGFEKIAGFDVLASNETPGFGDQIKYAYFRDQFIGAPVGELQAVRSGDVGKIDTDIVAISGATISSEAVVAIISNAVTQIRDQMREKGLIGNGK